MQALERVRWFLFFVTISVSCTTESPDESPSTINSPQGLASVEAVFYNFEWDATLVASGFNIDAHIDRHIRWTVGQLNGDNSIGRLDLVQVSDVETQEGTVTYHAKMVVAWGRNEIPASYTFVLPRQVDSESLSQFVEKYADSCLDDPGDHELTTQNGWYYYRPKRSTCAFDDEDVVSLEAQLSPSDQVTTGKYPEYHKIWEDRTLRVIAIFGKTEEDGDENDEGYRSFNRFVHRVARMLRPYEILTVPPDLQTSGSYFSNVPAPEVTDAELRGFLPDDRRVVVNAFMVPSLTGAGTDFFEKYESLSAAADFIAYNGHADLGNNVSLLARRGKWVRDQWVAVLMNGCDTFAYIDPALERAHLTVNLNDQPGSTYLDLINNSMPVLARATAPDTMAVVNGMMAVDDPKTYEEVLAGFSASQVAVVSGEEDNLYTPGFVGADWTVEYGVATGAPKTWTHYGPFEVDPGGLIKIYTSGINDADLYVKEGQPPTQSNYDCVSGSPYSNEQCVLQGSGQFFVGVFAWTPEEETIFDITVVYNGTDVDIDMDVDADTDGDADTDSDTDSDGDGDAPTDSDADSDSDTNLDTNSETDSRADDETDTGGGGENVDTAVNELDTDEIDETDLDNDTPPQAPVAMDETIGFQAGCGCRLSGLRSPDRGMTLKTLLKLTL